MTTVFLHGLGQTAASWDEALALLPEAGDCRCPELPEMLSGKAATYQNLYAALEQFCNALPGQLTLCGLSLGAVLALDYGIHHPQKLRSLILIAPQYKMPRLLLAVQNLLFRFMPERNFQGLGFSKQDFTRLCTTTGQQNLTKGLERICCPTLILCGESDKANRTAAQSLSQRIPHSRLVILPGCGHEVNTDNPPALAREIRSFLEG